MKSIGKINSFTYFIFLCAKREKNILWFAEELSGLKMNEQSVYFGV